MQWLTATSGLFHSSATVRATTATDANGAPMPGPVRVVVLRRGPVGAPHGTRRRRTFRVADTGNLGGPDAGLPHRLGQQRQNVLPVMAGRIARQEPCRRSAARAAGGPVGRAGRAPVRRPCDNLLRSAARTYGAGWRAPRRRRARCPRRACSRCPRSRPRAPCGAWRRTATAACGRPSRGCVRPSVRPVPPARSHGGHASAPHRDGGERGRGRYYGVSGRRHRRRHRHPRPASGTSVAVRRRAAAGRVQTCKSAGAQPHARTNGPSSAARRPARTRALTSSLPSPPLPPHTHTQAYAVRPAGGAHRGRARFRAGPHKRGGMACRVAVRLLCGVPPTAHRLLRRPIDRLAGSRACSNAAPMLLAPPAPAGTSGADVPGAAAGTQTVTVTMEDRARSSSPAGTPAASSTPAASELRMGVYMFDTYRLVQQLQASGLSAAASIALTGLLVNVISDRHGCGRI